MSSPKSSSTTALFLIILFSVFSLIGCGGGGGGGDVPPAGSNTPTTPTTPENTSDILTGVFLDSAVQGLKYVTDTLTGTTDAEGTFKYREGEIVKFYLGDVFIGQIFAKSTITPMDIVLFASIDTPDLVNLLRLLQTLDIDSNPANGITLPVITEGLGADLELTNDTDVQGFVTEINPVLQLKDAASSIEHMFNTLKLVATPTVYFQQISYVFSHAYSVFSVSGTTGRIPPRNINTVMDADLKWIDGETVQLNIVLPSGYEVNYTGPMTVIASITSTAVIRSMMETNGVVYLTIIDPLSDEKYAIRFYDGNYSKNINHISCGTSEIVKRIRGRSQSLVTHTLSYDWRDFYSMTGGYIETATMKINYDGKEETMEVITDGIVNLSPNQDGVLWPEQRSYDIEFYEPATVENSFTVTNDMLIEKKDLSVQYVCKDSRGVTKTSDVIWISRAEQGDGKYSDPTDPSDPVDPAPVVDTRKCGSEVFINDDSSRFQVGCSIDTGLSIYNFDYYKEYIYNHSTLDNTLKRPSAITYTICSGLCRASYYLSPEVPRQTAISAKLGLFGASYVWGYENQFEDEEGFTVATNIRHFTQKIATGTTTTTTQIRSYISNEQTVEHNDGLRVTTYCYHDDLVKVKGVADVYTFPADGSDFVLTKPATCPFSMTYDTMPLPIADDFSEQLLLDEAGYIKSISGSGPTEGLVGMTGL